MDDLKDPLIGNLVFAGKIGDAFATGVSGTYLLVSIRFGKVFRWNWLNGTRNALIEEVKHTLDSAVH